MDAVELIELYSTLFYVFLGIAALGLVCAVFFFFYFDIPTTRAMMTGKAKQNTIRKMEEQNAKTGDPRFQYPGHTGDVASRGNTGRMNRTGKTGRTVQTGRSGNIQAPQPAPVQVPQELPETAVLGGAAYPYTGEQEQTTVLGNAAYPQTGELEQTAVLHRAPSNFRFEVTESTIVIHTDEII